MPACMDVAVCLFPQNDAGIALNNGDVVMNPPGKLDLSVDYLSVGSFIEQGDDTLHRRTHIGSHS